MKIKYTPQKYALLSDRLIRSESDGLHYNDIELTRQIINMFVKLGFILLARDTIQQINGRYKDADLRIHVEYHLYNFIYYTKAFLDSIAITLNYVYRLDLTYGEIDLNKPSFLNKLEKKSNYVLSIVKEIKNKRKKLDIGCDSLAR